MPKIITGLRDRIMTAARDMLLDKGFEGVTIRDVAKACRVAVGTVYNYFPTKDTLIASVILTDWLAALDRLQALAERADTLQQGLQGVYDELNAFSALYSPAWASYQGAANAMAAVRQRHGLLVDQLTAPIARLCRRLSLQPEAICLSVAAEALLARSLQGVAFEQLLPALTRLLT